MNIIGIKALQGANYYFEEPVIMMTLDIGEWCRYNSSDFKEFTLKLKEMLPTLSEHHCSEGMKGGLLARIDEGTGFAHIIEHVAIELQNMAGIEVGAGKTRIHEEPSIFHVVYRYIDDESGIYAGKKAVYIVEYILHSLENMPEGIERKIIEKPDLETIINEITEIKEEFTLGPSTSAIVAEAKRSGIPVIRLDKKSLVQLGAGKFARRIRATATDMTNIIAVDTAEIPSLVQSILDKSGIPIIQTRVTENVDEAIKIAETIGFPLVVKPYLGQKGKGITLNVRNEEELKSAYYRARSFTELVILEEYIEGFTYRFLVINGKTAAVARRTPASVIGDGEHTISQLADIENKNPRRGSGDKPLGKIVLDNESDFLLKSRGYRTDTILKQGEQVSLQISCSPALGGYSVDVTKMVHQSNCYFVERAVKIVGLDIAGVDVVAPSIREFFKETGGKILGVSTSPDFRPHINPAEGQGKNVAKSVIDMLFPEGSNAWIPLIAVAGTSGKTSTSHMITHILTSLGEDVGLASSEGIFMGTTKIKEGDSSNANGAQTLLRDPEAGCAIIEVSHESIEDEGLGYQKADVSVLLNLHDEYNDRNSERTEYLKKLVIRQTEDWGIAVLNADDDLVSSFAKEIRNEIIYFSSNEDNPVLKEHLDKDGTLVLYKNGEIIVRQGNDSTIPLARIYELPFTHSGKASWQIYNSLAAAASVLALGRISEGRYKTGKGRVWKPADLHFGMVSFYPSINDIPGLLNYLKIDGLEIFFDRAITEISMEYVFNFISRQFTKNKMLLAPLKPQINSSFIDSISRKAVLLFDRILLFGDIEESEWYTSLYEKNSSKITVYKKEQDALDEISGKIDREALMLYVTDNPRKSAVLLLKLQEKLGS
ncbi:MAG: acetate--CoA ligase family protein [Candidatus Coatesbacteria bacterium]|nr:acetate--CoA ligase family protein [Candidatus Coatesbacteria bacterium]